MFEPLSSEIQSGVDSFEKKVLAFWDEQDLLAVILRAHADSDAFVFYEGPPTANGRPGIHHVLARTLKDVICRFQTMQGRKVLRKAGWDTHGLPVELEVEKQLGISGKPEIEKYGIGPFNKACRDSVFTYKKEWEELSRRIGYLLDYEDPYVTFDSNYVESAWFLLGRFAANDLLYPGYKVLPWCGRCGTGLSSHEVGQGYKDIDDPSVWVSFPLIDAPGKLAGAALVGWTTTPWTLPSNMGVCVHPEFEYAVIKTAEGKFVLLESQASALFEEGEWEVVDTVRGIDLAGLSYQPLFEFDGGTEVNAGDRRHLVCVDSFVCDDDGTGVVHLAPYGADDFRIAKRDGIQAVLAVGEEARFLCQVGDVTVGTFFRDANHTLCDDLKARKRLLKKSQCNHTYPHCWRCDTPLIYLPSPAWFIRTTAYKEQMIEENRKIQWAPAEIGAGRFGEWLENNVDWALSRDRYWGTPLPVWVCEQDSDHWHCVSSFAELNDLSGAVKDDFDPHRPQVDKIKFGCTVEGCAGRMSRVKQVIDCWFDSGAMPFAQYHWPFENRTLVAEQFPADFIAEGVDQTRGWFYTMHAIGVFLTIVDQDLWKSGELWGQPLPRLDAGSSYRSVMVNGLLLDAEGRKMSKRLGNIVAPLEAVAEYGADAVRWSLLSGGAVHLSRRFDSANISEVRRKVIGTLVSSYDFFALYARTEDWQRGDVSAVSDRPALDRWIKSRVTACASSCTLAFGDLEPARALKAIETLVNDELSNWYIRRNRRRFWNADDKVSQQHAFDTLWEVLTDVSKLIAPVTPFLAESLWQRLHGEAASIHLAGYPPTDGFRDLDLEGAMAPILSAASLGRSVRERVQIRVRQPLSKLMVHVAGADKLKISPREYGDSLLQELNIKEVEWIDGTPDFIEVRAKPNYPRLGKRAGKNMKALASAIGGLDRSVLFKLQGGSSITLQAGDGEYEIDGDDVILETLSVDGLEAATDGLVTIGLATEINDSLLREGYAREIVNRVQGLRRDTEFEVSDRIILELSGSDLLRDVVGEFGAWISSEVLAPDNPKWSSVALADASEFELPGDQILLVRIKKVQVGK